jgi:formylglycine-generating enzyme required for sulfatase activity
MAAEGEDDRGRWADVRLGEELLRVRLVPALTFTMGSPPDEEGRQEHETPHEVTLTSARWTATTEVTRRQWSAVLDVPVEEPGDLPIANVSWHEVESFLARLRQQGIPARLPTEAEWEQAARAGSVHAHADGPTPAPGAWLQQPPEAGPRPVAQGAANRLGLHDLDGNLAEWTADTWDGVRPLPADPVTDPCETFGGHQVVRGGSWDSTPLASRCAARRTQEPQLRDPRIGFRFVIPMP